MKKARVTGEQIIGALNEAEAGAMNTDLARRQGVSEVTIFHSKSN